MLKCLENIFAINLDQKPIATNEANENIAGGRQSSGAGAGARPGRDAAWGLGTGAGQGCRPPPAPPAT